MRSPVRIWSLVYFKQQREKKTINECVWISNTWDVWKAEEKYSSKVYFSHCPQISLQQIGSGMKSTPATGFFELFELSFAFSRCSLIKKKKNNKSRARDLISYFEDKLCH